MCQKIILLSVLIILFVLAPCLVMSLMSLYEIKSDAADANSQKFQRKMVAQSILGGILPDLCGNLTMEN